MFHSIKKRQALLSLGLLVLCLVVGSSALSQDPPSDDGFAKYRAVIDRHFASLPNYEPGFILSVNDVKPLLKHLQTVGWTVSKPAKLYKKITKDSHFVVRLLRTKQGRKFMRVISKLPKGYDKLVRLSSISGGRKLVGKLVREKGGEELIKYLATSKGGKELGKMLANSKKGKYFNKPTGMIYTQVKLTSTLEELYQAQQAPKSKP